MTELCTLQVNNTSNRRLTTAGLTAGIPLRRGALQATTHLALRTPQGESLPVQSCVTQRWDNGSIRWLVLDWTMPLAANEATALALEVVGTATITGSQVLHVTQTPDSITVSNAFLTVCLGSGDGDPLRSWRVNGREMLAPGSDLVLETPEGKLYCSSLARTTATRLLVQGPERVVVEATGRMTAEDDTECLDFRLRYTFRAADPTVLISHKMTNRETPELGVQIARLWWELPTTLGPRTRKTIRQMSHGLNWWPRPVEIHENVELQAGSFTSDMTRAVYGASQDGKVVIRNFGSLREDLSAYPHYLRPGNARTDMSGGLKATYPHLIVQGARGGALAWLPQMELHHPKGIAFGRGGYRFDLWPGWAPPLRLNRGMSREHDIRIAFFDQHAAAEAIEAVYLDHEVTGFGIFACGAAPVTVTLAPDHARACEVFDLHQWLPYDESRYLPIETKLGSAGARGQINGRGELNLGDGIIRDCSGNNENDVILDQFRAYFRHQEPSLLDCALLGARHNAHVDFIAFDPDPLRQGTMAAHCPNHSDGATYPSHMWVGGLLAAYCLTGNPDYEAVALAVGDNMRRWQTQRPEIFYCDSRECGWPMLAYVQLWHHTHDPKWLAYADEVFVSYRQMMNADGEILHDIPHGMGTFRVGYGEFMTWRGCFAYYAATQKSEVREFLITCLAKPGVYKLTPGRYVKGGWACNDLFPAWAAYTLTGEARYLHENTSFLKFLMTQERFAWGGVDLHYFLNALHERQELADFCH